MAKKLELKFLTSANTELIVSIADPKDGLALAAVQAEVDPINARLGGWRFQIPAFKYATIDKTIDDLLQPVGD